MKLYLYSFDKNNEFSATEEISFSDVFYPLSQLKTIDKCLAKIYAKKYDDFIEVNFDLDVKLTAISSYTNNEGDLPLHIKDNISFALSNEEYYSDFETFTGNYIDLDYYIYSLIIAFFPSKIVFKGEKLPESTDTVIFMSEEEYKEKKKEKSSSPFDVLDKI